MYNNFLIRPDGEEVFVPLEMVVSQRLEIHAVYQV